MEGSFFFGDFRHENQIVIEDVRMRSLICSEIQWDFTNVTWGGGTISCCAFVQNNLSFHLRLLLIDSEIWKSQQWTRLCHRFLNMDGLARGSSAHGLSGVCSIQLATAIQILPALFSLVICISMCMEETKLWTPWW